MTSNQVPWTKPQLITLSRGTPEEAVLTHCKAIGMIGMIAEFALAQLGCDAGDPFNCGNCQSRSAKS